MFAARRRSPVLATRRYLGGRRVAQGDFSDTILELIAFGGLTLSPCYKTMRAYRLAWLAATASSFHSRPTPGTSGM